MPDRSAAEAEYRYKPLAASPPDMNLSVEVDAGDSFSDADEETPPRTGGGGAAAAAAAAAADADADAERHGTPREWIPFVRPLAGHADRVKACCSLTVVAEQYATLVAQAVWPKPRSDEEAAVKFLVETEGWGMEDIMLLHDKILGAGDDSPRNLFTVKQFEGDLASDPEHLDKILGKGRLDWTASRGLSKHHSAAAAAGGSDTRTETALPVGPAARALALSCSDDDTLKLWDMKTGKCIRTFYGHTQIVRSCCITKPSDAAELPQIISCSADLTLKTWDMATGLCLRTLGEVESKEKSDKVPVLRSKQARESRQERLLALTTSRGSFGSRGSHLTPTSSTRSEPSPYKSVFNTRKRETYLGEENAAPPRPGQVGSAISAARSESGQKEQRTVSAVDPHPQRDGPHTSWVMSCCVFETTDGHARALSASMDGTMKVWDLESGAQSAPLYTFGRGQHGHTKWIMGCDIIRCAAVYADAVYAVSCSQDYKLMLWKLDESKHFLENDPAKAREIMSQLGPIRILEGHQDWLNSCCVFREGHMDDVWKILSCSDDKTLKVWDVSDAMDNSGTMTTENNYPARRGCIGTLRGHTSVIISCCTFEDKDRQVRGVSSSSDNTLRVWDLKDYRCIRTLSCMDGSRGCWVHDNHTLISCCGLKEHLTSHTVRLWDLSKILKHQEDSVFIKNSFDKESVTGWSDSITIDHQGHHGGNFKGTYEAIKGRRASSGKLQIREIVPHFAAGVELAYGSVNVDGAAKGQIAQVAASFENGCLAVGLTQGTGQPDENKLIDVSKVFASETLTSLIRSFKPIGKEWLLTLEKGEGSEWGKSTTDEEDLTELSAATAALRWAEKVIAARTGSLQVAEDVALRSNRYLLPISETEEGRRLFWDGVASGNKHKWRADIIQKNLAYFAEQIRRCEYKSLLDDARVLSWASIALILSVGLEDDQLPRLLESTSKRSQRSLLTRSDSWISRQMNQTSTGDDTQRIDIALSFQPKELVKYFLDAFIVLQTDTECCRTELDELLDSSYVANLFTNYDALLASFIEHLPLRRVRQKDYLMSGDRTTQFVVVGTESVHYRTAEEDQSGRSIWLRCCSKAGLFKGTSAAIWSPESTVQNRSSWWSRSRYLPPRKATRYLVPLLGTGVHRPEDLRLITSIVLQTDKSEPDMFRGETLHAIVAYQWQTWVRSEYYWVFGEYVLFTCFFTYLSIATDDRVSIMKSGPMFEHESDLWSVWLICVVYTFVAVLLPWASDIVRIIRGFGHDSERQMKWNGCGRTRRLIELALIVKSLTMVMLEDDNARMHELDMWQGLTLLICGLQIASMLRGFKWSAFLINMLEHIVADMFHFLIVLGLALVTFTLVFYLLLHDSDAEYDFDRPHEFDHLSLRSFLAVIRLALGDFGLQSAFSLSPQENATYSVVAFFTFLVPVLLLNALIAIMVRTRFSTDHQCMALAHQFFQRALH